MNTLHTGILPGFGAGLSIVGVTLGLALVQLLRLGQASDAAILRKTYLSTLAAESMIHDIEGQDSGVLLTLLDSMNRLSRSSTKVKSAFCSGWAGPRTTSPSVEKGAFLQPFPGKSHFPANHGA